MLSRNMKIKIDNTKTCLLFLVGETLSVILREELRPRVLGNRVSEEDIWA